MPYTGKPSYGCETCKKRHIKCDEAKPACNACISTKRICPGYRDRLDTVIRNQNDAARQAVQRRQRKNLVQRTRPVPDPLPVGRPLPREIMESLTTRATSFYFQNYVSDLIDIESLTARTYNKFLFPLYSAAKPDAPLRLATEAVALAVWGAWQREHREAEHPAALESFSQALVSTQKAILDPVESKRDATLMAVLLLGLYEDLTRRTRSQRPSGKHGEGSVALIKHRGVQNFETELSRRLLITARTQSLTYGVPDPGIWEEPENMQHTPASLLDVIIKDSLALPPEEADALLATWPQKVPESWHPVRVASEIDSYHGCDVYPDLSVMSLFNQWRCARIKVGGAVQEMVDGICASIPFALGDRVKSGPLHQAGARYPHLEGVPTSGAHYRTASALGGWYLLGPLMVVMGLEIALRENQKMWVMGQLRRVMTLYEVKPPSPAMSIHEEPESSDTHSDSHEESRSVGKHGFAPGHSTPSNLSP